MLSDPNKLEYIKILRLDVTGGDFALWVMGNSWEEFGRFKVKLSDLIPSLSKDYNCGLYE